MDIVKNLIKQNKGKYFNNGEIMECVNDAFKKFKSLTSFDMNLILKCIKFDKETNKFYLELTDESNKTCYIYPKEMKYAIIKRELKPCTECYIHDEQFDDDLDEKRLKLLERYNKLRALKYSEQRSPEWFAERNSCISASDCGSAIGTNHYEPQFNIIIKKVGEPPFISNLFCYHGKKYEEIATMIYEYRMNVHCEEFGLIKHYKYEFLGCSPDRIISPYKYNRIHKTKLVGRMLEIKVPYSRKINVDSEDISEVCPIYYFAQVMIQLACTKLKECDFHQCTIEEYSSREEFIQDTDPSEPFRSLETGLEKGCVIQLLPMQIDKTSKKSYEDIVYEQAIFIYPPKIEMSPYDVDKWISETVADYRNNENYKNYVIDKVIYWKLTVCKTITIKFDKEWFKEKLKILRQMWKYITFLRKHKDRFDIWNKYVIKIKAKYADKFGHLNQKYVDDIMEKLKLVCDPDNKEIIEILDKEFEATQKSVEEQRNKNRGFKFKKKFKKSEKLISFP